MIRPILEEIQLTSSPTSSKRSDATYFLIQNTDIKRVGFSLTRDRKADFFTNQALLNNLVGTLVKYGAKGTVEPYLAKRWEVSSNGKKWTFYLRKGLRCESGESITAQSFVKNLREGLLQYDRKGGIRLFKSLRGWEDFKRSKSELLQGLYAKDNSLVFEFDNSPDGLFNFLRMVYFGYWCKSKDGKFVSSAGYSVKENLGHKVVLSKRRDKWFTSTKIDQVIYAGIDLHKEIPPLNRSIVRIGTSRRGLQKFENFNEIRTAPSLLTSFILSPIRDGIFKNKSARQYFSYNVRKCLRSEDIGNEDVHFARGFYATSKPFNYAEVPKPILEGKGIRKRVRAVIHNRSSNSVKSLLENCVSSVIKSLGYEVEFLVTSKKDPKWADKYFGNKFYDIRVSTVDTDPTYVNSTIDMMFCSTLGVSFPDPSGRICDLAEKQRSKDRPDIISDEYKEKFSRIVVDDATVIPILHGGFIWLFSKDFDLETVPRNFVHPLFSSFRFVSD